MRLSYKAFQSLDFRPGIVEDEQEQIISVAFYRLRCIEIRTLAMNVLRSLQ